MFVAEFSEKSAFSEAAITVVPATVMSLISLYEKCPSHDRLLCEKLFWRIIKNNIYKYLLFIIRKIQIYKYNTNESIRFLFCFKLLFSNIKRTKNAFNSILC
jgi:hypothetical protein